VHVYQEFERFQETLRELTFPQAVCTQHLPPDRLLGRHSGLSYNLEANIMSGAPENCPIRLALSIVTIAGSGWSKRWKALEYTVKRGRSAQQPNLPARP
jgi:hypothetical protein